MTREAEQVWQTRDAGLHFPFVAINGMIINTIPVPPPPSPQRIDLKPAKDCYVTENPIR